MKTTKHFVTVVVEVNVSNFVQGEVNQEKQALAIIEETFAAKGLKAHTLNVQSVIGRKD